MTLKCFLNNIIKNSPYCISCVGFFGGFNFDKEIH